MCARVWPNDNICTSQPIFQADLSHLLLLLFLCLSEISSRHLNTFSLASLFTANSQQPCTEFHLGFERALMEMEPGSFYEMYLLSDLHNVRSEERMAPAAVKRWWLEKLCNLGDVILFSHCLPHAFTLKQQNCDLRQEFASQLLKSELKLKDRSLCPSKSVNFDCLVNSDFHQLVI